MWLVLAILVFIAVIADGIASGLSLQAFFHADNVLTEIFVFGAGFVITGIVSFTPKIFSEDSPVLLKLLWFIAAGVDLYTTFVVVVFYLVLHHPYSESPDVYSLRYDPNNWAPTLLALALPTILTGMTMMAQSVIDHIES